MAEINNTKDKLMMELDKQVNIVDMTYKNMGKWKEKLKELSDNIITDEQIDLNSPEWKFLENDTDSKFTERTGYNWERFRTYGKAGTRWKLRNQ